VVAGEHAFRALVAASLYHGTSQPERLAMTTRTEEYRINAKECAERARLSPDPETKRQYEEAEKQWLDLAKRAEGERR
jgi:hypothetical protein